jgi:hypothetical protein
MSRVKLRCAECLGEIPLADVNVAKDLALCRKCDENFSYSEVCEAPETPIDLARPPRGTWFKRNARGFEVGISTRHPASFFLVPFMLIWSGFSIGGIYGPQIKKGELDLFDSLFGVPFLIGTVVFGAVALMSVLGKIVVRVENSQGTTFTGLGPFGWRRRFRWDEVKEIRQSFNGTSNGKPMKQVTIHADRPIGVSIGLNEKRQQFLLETLRHLLRERN